MDLNDALPWLVLVVTVAIGAAGLYFQHQALKIAREDAAISKQQLVLDRKRSRKNSEAELRKLELEAQKLAERKAAREQRAMGAVLRWIAGQD